ncbi:hypothetical protein ALC53_00865, partial [Atta colombica]
ERYLRTSAKLWYRLCELESSDVVELQHLQHFLGLWIDLDDVVLQSRDFRNIVVSAFPLFFLQLDGDTTYLTVSKPLHQISLNQYATYLPSNLIAQGFARNNSNFLAYPLIRVKIQSETWIVFLDNEFRGLFDRLRSDTTLQIV